MNDVRIACAQVAPRVGEAEGNRRLAREALREAIAAGARIVLLPELVTSGYVLESAEEARSLALPVEELSDWAEEAARGEAVVIGGFAELGEDGSVYNSAAVFGPGGLLAVYRKTHLWDREKLCFEPGGEQPPVVETPLGRIGVAVCYDLYFPELTRGLALAGADLVALPANLPLFPRPEDERPVEIALAQATAHVSKVWVAVCDRTGLERGVEWTGASCIVDPDGWLAAGPVEGDGEEILYADCELARARDKAWGERNHVVGDLRPELYPTPRPASDPSRIASSSERGESRSPASTAP
ncbi:MAG TPA: nitrilase-related carbon-nitrogen hydrolase [Gaiellaceae bacterium]|nr:nitrilase-related carbon-nitrogen hydrolase [Gaiellaceae bacterium]